MATKKRFIDANELDSKLEALAQKFAAQGRFETAKDYSFVQTVLLSARTVDAVEVVRCKECKSWEQYNACDGSKPHRCMNLNAIFHMRTAPDDFCSYGERRTDHV